MANTEEFLQIGDPAPDFLLPSTGDKEVSLDDFLGKYVVLYFYPKDNTPGCTTEACDFRNYHDEFKNLNAVILGVSPDPLKSHEKFIDKYQLPFLLLSDEKHQVAEKYGVWVMKKNYGREYLGIERSTFIIDKEGKLLKAYRKVKVKGHVETALDLIKSLEEK